MERFFESILSFVVLTLIRLVIYAVMTLPVWWLWNGLAEGLPQLPMLTYGQTFAVYILFQILVDPIRPSRES